MYNKLFRTFFLFILLSLTSNLTITAQINLLAEYTNKVFFGFSTDHVDSSFCKFLNKHVNKIYCQAKSKTDTVSGWSVANRYGKFIYPPINSTHSLYFSKHPFLKENFSNGKIEIQTNESFEDNVLIESICIYFYFVENKDAINLFRLMDENLSKICTKKKYSNYKRTQMVEFSDELSSPKSGIQIILKKDLNDKINAYYLLVIPHSNI